MPHTQDSFGFKKIRNGVSMTKKSCRAWWIRLVQCSIEDVVFSLEYD